MSHFLWRFLHWSFYSISESLEAVLFKSTISDWSLVVFAAPSSAKSTKIEEFLSKVGDLLPTSFWSSGHTETVSLLQDMSWLLIADIESLPQRMFFRERLSIFCCDHWSSKRQSTVVLRPRDRITPARGLIKTQQTHKSVSGPTNRRSIRSLALLWTPPGTQESNNQPRWKKQSSRPKKHQQRSWDSWITWYKSVGKKKIKKSILDTKMKNNKQRTSRVLPFATEAPLLRLRQLTLLVCLSWGASSRN